MDNAIIKNTEIIVKIEWECPFCGHVQTENYSTSAYSAVSEDPADTSCEKCEEFVTLQV